MARAPREGGREGGGERESGEVLDVLWMAGRVGILGAEVVERYADFFFRQLVALLGPCLARRWTGGKC